MLRKALGGGRGSHFLEKIVTKMYGSTLLALREGWWVSNFQGKNRYLNDSLDVLISLKTVR